MFVAHVLGGDEMLKHQGLEQAGAKTRLDRDVVQVEILASEQTGAGAAEEKTARIAFHLREVGLHHRAPQAHARTPRNGAGIVDNAGPAVGLQAALLAEAALTLVPLPPLEPRDPPAANR